MRVLLKGIGGVYNYGCEAIVRGTVNMLRMIDPAIQIDYASFRMDDDRKRLKGCDVNIIPVYKKWSIRNILKAVLNRLHIKNSIPLENYSEISKYNAVFSIGGDIYTIYPGGTYARDLVRYGEECYRKNVPYILWGCSVGPFDEYPKVKEIFRKHLSHISLIVARERATINYLGSMNIKDNVVFSYDPAFYVRPLTEKKKSSECQTIGINLSPLSLKFLHKDIEVSSGIHARLIEKIIHDYKKKVILIPHVVDTIREDNDFLYLKKVYGKISPAYSDYIKLVSSDPGFIGLQEDLSACDILIGARMHCCINAITCGVPALFLSYSEKSKGMSKLVYGKEVACVPLEDFNEDNINGIMDLCESLLIKSNLREEQEKSFSNLKQELINKLK